MLTELHIEDLGVIERVDLVLGHGLTALTGETGAGKTMLVEAVNLLVGGRADSVMVRAGASEARVEGRFVSGEREWVVARVIPAEGRSRAYVDGRLATAATLAELGAELVDLHGQHAHQSLLGATAQRACLDRFAGVDLTPLQDAQAEHRSVLSALEAMGGDARTRAREADLLRFQRDELVAASLDSPDEDDYLSREEDLLAGAAAHREAGARAVETVTGDDGVVDLLGLVIGELDSRGVFDDQVARLRSALAEVDDVAAEVRRRVETVEEDPARLDRLRSRRHLFRELRRKYGDTLADVIAYRGEVATRLAELEGHEERAAALEAERERLAAVVLHEAMVVGAARRAAADGLAAAVMAHLADLAMPKAHLTIAVGEPPADPAGESITFLLAANPGSPPLPLSKVASGGELARTMLALRLVLTEAPDTLVFDEVDAGIGGAAANAVAGALATLGRRHQVLVVTHLAQVAAAATHQVVVEKEVVSGTTVARAVPLTEDARVDEIARMLSGGAAADSARRHARDLLGATVASERVGER